jgi:parallel beta-helix repeat protein
VPKLRSQVAFMALVFGALTVATLSVLAGTARPQLAQQLGCGDKITRDTKLQRDLLDCRNNGIVIGADGVTLNLNGHTIDGDGTPAAGCNPREKICDVGVVSVHDGVTIKGGEVRDFDPGVFVYRARHNLLRDLGTVENTGNGIVLSRSARTRVLGSSASRNGLTTDFPGLVLFESHNNRIANNTLSGNGDLGLILYDSDRNQVSYNALRRNPEGGMIIDGDGNVFARNRLIRNGGGILISEITDRDPAVGNVLRRNYVRDSRADGISVDRVPKRTLLSRNHVFGAGTSGIKVGSPSTTLTRNEARRNGKLGIYAVPGVIDGGGNRASGNGDPRQCVNIVCG